jgi:hypothetical protein
MIHKEERFYTIEFNACHVDNKTGEKTYAWEELEQTLSGEPFRFPDEALAVMKAKEIAAEGRWGCKLDLRVIKRIIHTESWHICELLAKDYYKK